jgi:5-methylcytosine-specific restriction protein B
MEGERSMKTSRHSHLPLAPLLHAYTRAGVPTVAELHHLPGLGPRFTAILSATAKFLYVDFLENASTIELTEALLRFYEACVQPPLHVETLRRRAGMVRHCLMYLLRGCDALPIKMAACLDAAGTYHVAGLGARFWSALLQALRPTRHPGWTPPVVVGLERLGLTTWRRGDDAQTIYGGLQSAYERIRTLEPELSALHLDHFLTLVAAMKGRNLPDNDELAEEPGHPSFAAAIQLERSRLPLRQRLKDRGQAMAQAQERMETALANCDGKGIGDALAVADTNGCLRSPLDWGKHGDTLTLWVGRLWESDEPYRTLTAFWNADPLPGAGLWLPAAVLHLRDPQNFAPWDEDSRAASSALDDSAGGDGTPTERYRLFNEGNAWLRQRYAIHPLELPAVVASLQHREIDEQSASFAGFCADTFYFLGELSHNNKREWMERQRERYRFAVREPLLELCRTLGERYVEPVLRGVYGWCLDAEPRSGRALTSICKNAYGRTQPYNTALWIAFCRRTESGRREDIQFFVRVDGDGLRYGLRLGRKARGLVAHFREQIRRHAEMVFRALRERGALTDCRFRADGNEPEQEINTIDDLLDWSEGRSFEISRSVAADAALGSGDELAGEIVRTFDRLLPLYACAVEEDARAILVRCLGGTQTGEPYTESDFERSTLLDREWIDRARHLLAMKGQLILQGVPGTGKTHVARHLARLLTGGRDECVRLVQFHPAYSYEEFVEGIRVRSATVDGRSDVTYPVEPGLLCAFAEEASRRPAETHVLLIDEINRGNLPRIFGELLYLLEYREQSVCLPCSRRSFRLPSNLYLLATMNGADRSVALIDRALRRRFSFLDMPPDVAVLARWLHVHTPAAGAAFAERVCNLFERLNARLHADLGPQGQIGHSYFMVPDLDEARLRLVWQHHVRPLLEEHFAGQPARLASYDFDKILNGGASRPERRERVCAV